VQVQRQLRAMGLDLALNLSGNRRHVVWRVQNLLVKESLREIHGAILWVRDIPGKGVTQAKAVARQFEVELDLHNVLPSAWGQLLM